jgi:hypothetical protein
MAALVLLSVLRRYAVSVDLIRPDAADEEIQTLTPSPPPVSAATQ